MKLRNKEGLTGAFMILTQKGKQNTHQSFRQKELDGEWVKKGVGMGIRYGERGSGKGLVVRMKFGKGHLWD